MMADGFPQRYLPVGLDAKRAVVLGQPLIEPGRRIANIVIHQQVSVLMKNYSEGILFALQLGSKSYVIYVVTCLEIAGNIRARLEWPVGAVALENYHRGGHG